jgi:iron complex outermembrane receptor protein
MGRDGVRAMLAGSVAVVAMATASPAFAQTRTFELPAQSAATGIPELARQGDIQILVSESAVRGRRTRAVRGQMTSEAALRRLIGGTGLRIASSDGRTFTLAANGSAESGEAQAGGAAAESGSADHAGVSEILVVGSRSLNADIRRTRDDVQPYVVFSHQDIQNSNATNLDDFLRTRLPQNAQRGSQDQVEQAGLQADSGGVGLLDLRGLGSAQTLILVDGRRLPNAGGSTLRQGNVNGIPLAAIERIEVLPSTAGAIYGGNAVGGVINIILRRDYSGVEAQLTYGNTFDGATGDFQASLVGGFYLSPTHTQITFTANRLRTGDLTVSERNGLLLRSRQLVLANDPAQILSATSPILGATPNICAGSGTSVLNRRCSGAPLTLDNGTPLNATITFVPIGYPGPNTAADGGAALIANAGRYNLDAPLDDAALIRGTQTDSLGLNIRQPLTSGIDLYADAGWDRVHGEHVIGGSSLPVFLAADDPANPFQQSILIKVPVSGRNFFTSNYENLRLTGGAIVRLPRRWSMSIEQSLAQSRSSSIGGSVNVAGAISTINALSTSDVNLFQDEIANGLSMQPRGSGPIRTSSLGTSLRLGGPLMRLPGGSLAISLLGERRLNRIDEYSQFSTGATGVETFTVFPSRRQEVRSLYGEVRAPLVGAANHIPAIRSLELQASLRYDNYVSKGTLSLFSGLPSVDSPHSDPIYFTNRLESVDYLVGLRYEPMSGIILRASYSTGFLPPDLNVLTPSFMPNIPVASIGTIVDPKRGGQGLIGNNGVIDSTGGGNPDLSPERSRSFSFGIILEPSILPGLRLSADYTRIRKSGEIRTLDLQTLINNEDLFPDRITRAPNLPGDPSGFAGPIIAFDRSALNVARSQASAWDFQLDYRFDTGKLGNFHPYLIATRQTAAEQQLVDGAPLVSRLGFNDGPLRWRGNLGIEWSLDSLNLGWNMQYYGGYFLCFSTDSDAVCNLRVPAQGTDRIPSQSYHDVSVRYTFGRSLGFLEGTELSFGVQNLFNHRPPVIAQASALFATYSSYGDPRLRRFTISLRRRFGH